MQDHIHNWRETALILTSILFPAAGIWFIGKFYSPLLYFFPFYKEEFKLTIHLVDSILVRAIMLQ